MTSSGDMVEVQATGEGGLLKRSELDALIDLGSGGIATLRQLQLDALGDAATRLGLRP
jgi:ribonuclease PH